MDAKDLNRMKTFYANKKPKRNSWQQEEGRTRTSDLVVALLFATAVILLLALLVSFSVMLYSTLTNPTCPEVPAQESSLLDMPPVVWQQEEGTVSL